MGSREDVPARVAFAAAAVLSAIFVAIARRHLAVLPWEYDEGTFMLGARFVARGLRPFVDLPLHQPPLHLYLLALSGKVFGATVFGYRMLSVASIAVSGLLLFALVRPFAGALPALLAQAIYLFSPTQVHALSAVGETPMLLFTLLGAALLFLGTGRLSAWASAVAFVVALLVKPTAIVMVAAAVLSLAYARAWGRLGHFALAGMLAAAAGVGWTFVVSDGIFADILRYTLRRVGARSGGLWSVDSGFADLRRLLHVETPWAWTRFCFDIFHLYPARRLPMALFWLAFLGLPLWVFRCARAHPAVRAFAVLWPLGWLLANFVGLDYVSSKYFVPFLPFTAFLLAAPVALLVRRVRLGAAAVAVGVLSVALAGSLATSLRDEVDPWYYGRVDWIAREYPALVSFSPMVFAATGTEPGCGLWNPPDTYGGFGEAVFGASERTRRHQFTDERVIECLRARPDSKLVVDFWFYFFTRPGMPLREYLRGEGGEHVLFLSPQALAEWDQPRITRGDVAR
ncbi:MAG TPA: glycosyltransferase family 39 protein [Candidatus Binatia bacterium]|nr:glycosyltransferase family 39 protein [Candidatus Binatia bacterium]